MGVFLTLSMNNSRVGHALRNNEEFLYSTTHSLGGSPHFTHGTKVVAKIFLVIFPTSKTTGGLAGNWLDTLETRIEALYTVILQNETLRR